ncbi:MAG: hypothetical protein JO287_27535 [Pseudonocardiales bacterium]|nr:hypothetical protein [Pseudonocardiales bacterium]
MTDAAMHQRLVDTLSPMQDEEAGNSQYTTGLEGALARVERALEASSKAVAALARELKRARAAAASGQVRELRRALDAGQAMAGDVVARVGAAATAYDVDDVDLLASGAYAKELLAAAEAAGVAMFAEDDRLLCYPSIVRVLGGDLALEIDRKRARGIRPSVVVAQLARAQRAGPRFKPAPFLASLVGAYDLVVAGQGKPPGAVVRLLDVYNALTLLPGQSRDYTRAEFARDLYLLDQSGETAAPGGRRLRWAASSGTRQAGVLTTVAMSGQRQRYWGIAVGSGHSESGGSEPGGSEPSRGEEGTG